MTPGPPGYPVALHPNPQSHQLPHPSTPQGAAGNGEPPARRPRTANGAFVETDFEINFAELDENPGPAPSWSPGMATPPRPSAANDGNTEEFRPSSTSGGSRRTKYIRKNKKTLKSSNKLKKNTKNMKKTRKVKSRK